MFSLTLKTIRAKKARFVLTGVAVMLGVAFMAGTLVLTDTIKQSYDDLAGQRVQGHRRRRAFGLAPSRADNGDHPWHASTPRSSTRSGPCPASQAAEPQRSVSRWSSATTASCSTPAATAPIPIAMAWQNDDRANPMELVDGHAPRAPNEIVIDRASADKGDFAVGDTIARARASPARRSTARRHRHLRRRGRRRRRPGRGVHARDRGRRCSVTPGRYDAINVVAAPGVSQTELVADLQTALRRTPTSKSSPAPRRSTKRATASGSQLCVPEHVPDDVRHRGAARRFVRDLQHLLDHRCAAHEGDRAAAGDRRQAQAGDAVGDARVDVTGLFASAIGVVAGIGTAKGIAVGVHRRSASTCRPAARVVNSSTIVDLDGRRHRRHRARGVHPGPPGGQGRTDRGPA